VEIRADPWQMKLLWHTERMHRLTLGDLELSVFSDGTYPLDGGAFFGVVPKVMWSRKVEADDKNYITAGLNTLVIRSENPRTGKQTVLVETGMGNKLSSRMVKFYGQPAGLLDDLAAGGIAPEDIDIVINSHLHFDHCGWNTVRDANGKFVATFPRAKYYAPEGEWQYARHPSERDSISFISENYDPLVESGQMTLLKSGEEISRTHGAYAGCDCAESGKDGLLYLRPDADVGAYRSDLGHGLRPVSVADD
jgi:glyoxylase-like metal-dependent hydrolase (beta-lactamase superfamily II)